MNWTAVGAIATAVAVIVALYVNCRTNRLQILLLRQQRAQKKLDEMVQNVMRLSQIMNPIEMSNFSSKFAEGNFTEGDMRTLEHIATEGSGLATNSTVQMVMLKNQDSARPMLDHFWNMWNDYNLWSRSISLLFQCEKTYPDVGQWDDSAVFEEIINDMVQWIVQTDSNSQRAIGDLLKEGNLRHKARTLLRLLGVGMAKDLLQRKKTLYEKVIEFVCVEQQRIDDMVA